jgi:hypothetical protein
MLMFASVAIMGTNDGFGGREMVVGGEFGGEGEGRS